MHIYEVKEFGGPEALQLVEMPDPKAGAGQIVVDVKVAGINFADVIARAGKYRAVPSAPFFPGLEAAGTVSEIGAGVEGFAVGDRVMGVMASGGYSTKAVLNASQAVKLPDGLGLAEGSALLIQGLTAYFLLLHGGIGPGKNVLVAAAAGGLGSLATQFAKLKGAGKVIGLASPIKHDRVRRLGADAAVDYTKPGWGAKVLETVGEKGIDIYLDSQGDLAGEGFDTLGYGSHWLIFGGMGNAGEPLAGERLGPIIGKNITLRGYNLYFDFPRVGEALAELIPWAASSKLKIDVESYPFAEAAAAHIAIADRKTSGKVVLVI